MAEDDDIPAALAEAAEGEDGEGNGKGSKKKLFIIIGVVVIVLIPVALFFAGIISFGDDSNAEEHGDEAAAHGEEEAGGHGDSHGDDHGGGDSHGGGHGSDDGHGGGGSDDGHSAVHAGPGVYFYELPEFLINLRSTSTKPSFLKMVVTLELPDEESIEKINALKPRITDSFQVYLRELRPTDLSGSAGIYRLREELLLRLRKAAHPVRINDILFKEIIVQ